MGNIKRREKYNRLDNTLWKKTKVDRKGRCVLPKKLRSKLGLNGCRSILWISIKRKDGRDNEFLIHVGVKK